MSDKESTPGPPEIRDDILDDPSYFTMDYEEFNRLYPRVESPGAVPPPAKETS